MSFVKISRSKIPGLLFFSCIHYFSYAQNDFKPRGIVLIPFEKRVAVELKDSIRSFTNSEIVTEEIRKQFIPDKLPLNWKLVRENELKIMAGQNYFSQFSLQLERNINYKLVENYENPLLFVVLDSSRADLPSYKKLVAQHKVDWIINPYSIVISKQQGKIKLDIKFQAYYHPLGYTMINTSLSFNEAELKDCSERTLSCMLNVASSKIAALAVDKIERVR